MATPTVLMRSCIPTALQDGIHAASCDLTSVPFVSNHGSCHESDRSDRSLCRHGWSKSVRSRTYCSRACAVLNLTHDTDGCVLVRTAMHMASCNYPAPATVDALMITSNQHLLRACHASHAAICHRLVPIEHARPGRSSCFNALIWLMSAWAAACRLKF